MGMFDEIVCKYPLSLPQYQDTVFQTKDLDSFMERFEIGEDRKLYRIINTYEERKPCPEGKRYIDWLIENPIKLLSSTKEPVLYHGVINFYTIDMLKDKDNEGKSIGYHEVEFDAYFSYGILDKIELRKNEDVMYNAGTQL